MQRVQFSGAEPFVVDDGVADALLAYAWELARYRRHDLVHLPARDTEGAPMTVALLLGPSSQLSTRTTHGVESVESATAADLLQRTALLHASLYGDAELKAAGSRPTG
jgi:hypothetical protein